MAGFALLLAAAVTLSAQAGNTGDVVGRVLNAQTGRYLNNARVSVQGTNLVAFTNEFGDYRLLNVPAGSQQLVVFFSGFGENVIPVEVTPGQTTTQNVSLGGTVDDDTIVLSAFTVAAGRDTDIASIAVNEQRFSPNIKTVIEADAFGDVAEGNIGEFLKFLPGVTVDYVAADVRTVSVRGFGAQFSSVYVDGFRMASSASGSTSRIFEFEQVSINNASRIELTKVPTPSMPADSLGGSVNMVSKNAFERDGAQFNYRAYLNMNSEEVRFTKTPGPGRKDTYKVLPGFDFDYTLPVSRNLGFVITGLSSNQFNEQHRSQTMWNFGQGGGTYTPPGSTAVTLPNATAQNPFLQQYVMQDGPKNSFRDSFSVKMDWRISENSTFWAGFQTNYYKAFFGNRNITWEAGSNGVPTPAAGQPLRWSSDFTEGATGRGSVRHGGSFRHKMGATNALLTKYRYVGRDWEIDAGLGYSGSKTWYRDMDRGHFSEVRTTLVGTSRVLFSDYGDNRPDTIRAVNAAGQDLDYYNLSNYRVNTVRSVPIDSRDEFRTAHINAKRALDGLPFPLAVRAGLDVRQQLRDIRRSDTTWNFVGPDGVANTADDNAGNFLDERYGVYSYWGFNNVQWYSPYKLRDAFDTNPGWFAQTPAQVLNAERFRIRNSQDLDETITSVYLQGEAKFVDNRLTVISGARYERTSGDHLGPYSPGTGLTLADVQANWRERGTRFQESYDGIYPSLHATFNVTDDFLVRVAYAKTLGRPDFGNIVPNVRANPGTTEENDGVGAIPANRIIYNNTALQPYEGNNYDLSLEYYFRSGLISFGLFHKDVEGFFGTQSGPVTADLLQRLQLPAGWLTEFPDMTYQTTVNTDQTTRITGYEFSIRHPLTFIPGIGQRIEAFLNLTKLDLRGSAEADFRGFIDESANLGLTYRHNPLTLRANLNYRGRQRMAPQTGAAYGGSAGGFYEYMADRFTLDLNAEYRYRRGLAFFANVRNVFNESQDLERYNHISPSYSHLFRREKFGAQITLGVKGTF
jgi:iron complex outermembrane recepter protein